VQDVRPTAASSEQPPPAGAGTQLKAILQRYRIQENRDCGCRQLASDMDRRGIAWCEANIDYIAGQLVRQARKRRWPVLEIAASLGLSGVSDTVLRQLATRLVRDAIEAARNASTA
jgi:hypothetical protein